ncbi:MAG TPA: hypothetical protein PLG50_01455 [bacterium]|nr:hypothetical protein [bacterium]HQG44310.1 hypothetical protein [bacterium]HQI49261.1 hypothetical protein [bacterium]HQJ63647.1 hypothetical protein [bacterium]
MLRLAVALTVIALILLNTLLFGGAIISSFQGEAGYNQVEIKWIVAAENNLRSYQLLRSLDNHDFESIAVIDAKKLESGEKTYSYLDKSVFKENNHEFYYKLRMVNDDGSTTDYDKVLRLTPQISSARQTWGSIKAMFR